MKLTHLVPLVTLCIGFALLTGCGVDAHDAGAAGTTLALSVGGSVHGGQQPIVGATITLMVPGTTAYGSAPSVLATAVTLAGGSFTLPPYTCPANSGDVYLLATGGNSGSGINSASVEAALLGPCTSLTPATFISVTEATTVAAAYALAPFATVTAASTGIGAPLTNQQGIKNAFAATTNLVPFPSGYAQAPNAVAGLVLPQAEINTLANILASCVNSTGSTAAGTTCGTLFTAATPPGGVAPVDTFQAALNIALNPGTNVATLYGLSSASGPFQPGLTTAPNDFALAIKYTGGGITGSYGTNGMAIDTLGNAWIVIGNTPGQHALVEISPAGLYISGATGYGTGNLSGPQGIAIDPANNVYVTDVNVSEVFKFASNGSLLSTFSPASLKTPLAIAIDTDNSLWITNNANATISHVSPTGADVAGSPFAASTNPFDIALNASTVWAVDFNNGAGKSGYLTEITKNGTIFTDSQFQVSGHAQGVAIDNGGYAWYTTIATNGSILGRENPTGGSNFTPIAIPSQYQGLEVFVDGLNTIWVSTQSNTQFTNPGAVLRYSNTGTLISPATGYQAAGAVVPSGDVPEGMAVDNSGNLWVSGYVLDASGNAVANPFVTELIGIAGPTVTPIATAAANAALGTRP